MIRSAMNDTHCSDEKWNRIFKKVALQGGKPSEDRIADPTGESQGSPVSIADENLDHKEEDKESN